MNSVLITAKGKTGFGQVPVPKPGPNQVLIKVDSAALNPSDILFMKGLYAIQHRYPYTPGWEGSGTVIEVGSGMMSNYFMGKRVAFMKQREDGFNVIGGAYAEYCLTSSRSCIPLADDISLEQGAAFFVNPLTALGMVDRLIELNAKSVIITAGASQIARMIINLCDQNGITPICTVRREEQAVFLKETMKVKHVVVTSNQGYQKELGKICAKLRPEACLECVAGQTTGEMLRFMGFRSTLILYGLLSE